MQVQKKIRLLWIFYRSFAVATLAITVCSTWIFYTFGLHAFFLLFWLKLATLGIVFFYVRKAKENEFFYYLNLGVSPPSLWIFSFGIDLTVFLMTLAAIYRMG